MKKKNLFSDLAEIVSEKEKKQKKKEIQKRKEMNKVVPFQKLQKQKFNYLYPMAKRTIWCLMKILRIRGRLYSLDRERIELCYSDGWPNDYNNRILTIRDDGSYFSIISSNSISGDKTPDLSQESLVEKLKETAFVKDALENL